MRRCRRQARALMGTGIRTVEDFHARATARDLSAARGGPCFWMEFPPPFGPRAWDRLRDYLSGLVASLPERPKAFLVVTSHWEAATPTVSVSPEPGMLFDYYGFPEHTYHLSYPAPGAPELGIEVKRLIETAGLPVATDESAASTTACSCPC